MSSLLLSQLPQGDGLGLSLPMWLLVGFAIAVAIYRAFPKRPNIPLVGFEVKNAQERKLLYSYNAPELLQRGYDKVRLGRINTQRCRYAGETKFMED